MIKCEICNQQVNQMFFVVTTKELLDYGTDDCESVDETTVCSKCSIQIGPSVHQSAPTPSREDLREKVKRYEGCFQDLFLKALEDSVPRSFALRLMKQWGVIELDESGITYRRTWSDDVPEPAPGPDYKGLVGDVLVAVNHDSRLSESEVYYLAIERGVLEWDSCKDYADHVTDREGHKLKCYRRVDAEGGTE